MRLFFSAFFLLFFVSLVSAREVRWDGQPIDVSISDKKLMRIEFPAKVRSAFLTRPDINLEREGRSLFIRATLSGTADTLFVVDETGRNYQIRLSTSPTPDAEVIITASAETARERAIRAANVPVMDLMRSMMLDETPPGYEVVDGKEEQVYRDSFYLMKLLKAFTSPALNGFVLQVENIATFPIVLRVEEIDFFGMVAISAENDYLRPSPRKASEAGGAKHLTRLYIVAVPGGD